MSKYRPKLESIPQHRTFAEWQEPSRESTSEVLPVVHMRQRIVRWDCERCDWTTRAWEGDAPDPNACPRCGPMSALVAVTRQTS